MSSKQLDSYSNPLIGHQLMSVEQKDYSWFFRFDSDVSVATESPWLFDDVRIVVTSEDDGQRFGLPDPVDAASIALSTIGGRKVEAAVISECSGDLTIEFKGRAQLQFLQISAGYESWRLIVGDSETICMGGGELLHFPGS